MSATLTFDMQNLNRKLAETFDAMCGMGGDGGTFVKDEGRLLLKTCIRFTAPKSLSQGRKAVKRAVTRAMRPFLFDPENENEEVAQVGLRKMIKKQDFNELNAFFQNVRGWSSWKIVPFSADLLKRVRDARGRVDKSQKRFVLPVAEWRKFLKNRQDHVGHMKAAWGQTYVDLGGKLPWWIAKHLPSPFGGLLENTILSNPQKPSITFQSRAIGVRFLQDKFSAACRARGRTLERRIKGALTLYGRKWKNGERITPVATVTAEGMNAGN